MNLEKSRQEQIEWQRGAHFPTYNLILGEHIAQSIIQNVAGASVLDLACGDGHLTSMLATHYERVVGVDASATHLEKARQRCPSVEFRESLIEDFATDERFDGVTMVCLLEHVVDPASVLRKAASFLKPGGTIIVHVPNAHAINRRIAVEMGTLDSLEELSPFDIEIVGHRRSYSLSTLVAEFEASDLKVTKTGGVFYKMLSTAQIDWLLSQGKWEGNEFGWGRVGGEAKDWRKEFCRACYEIGKTRPEDTNVIFACAEAENA